MDEYAAARAFLKGIEPLAACRRYILSDDAPASSIAALKRMGALLHKIAQIGGSRKLGPDEQANLANATASKAMLAASDACEAQIRKYHAARKEAQKRAVEALRSEAVEKGLLPLPRKHDLHPPAHFASLQVFEVYHDRLTRPDEPLDSTELKVAFEEYLSDWYQTQGFLYKPDFSALHNEFAERPTAKAGSVEALEKLHTSLPSDIARAAERGVATLEWTVQRKPHAADLLSAWMGGSTIEHLKRKDLYTLFSLCELIRERGASWWREVPGLGPSRALRIQQWIGEVGVQGVYMPANAFEPIQTRRLKEIIRNEQERPALAALASLKLEPLMPYVEREDLNGKNGIFRRTEPNMLKAETDIDAIVVVLGKYSDKPGTLKVYAREICRFCLWAYGQRRLPVSSLGVDDARLYREFLGNIPGEWISTSPSPAHRKTAEWKPFRGQLDQASQRKALTAINVVMGQMMANGYLSGNPMSGTLKHAELQRPKLDVARSLSNQQWQFIVTIADSELADAQERANNGVPQKRDPRPALRRAKALLHVLQTTGMRRDELFKARLSNIRRIQVDGEPCHLLEVTGKRSKPREVLIHPHVMQMVSEHLADRSPIFADEYKTDEGRKKIPLISVLSEPLFAPKRGKSGRDVVLAGRERASDSGALSPDGMQAALERLFKTCADLAPQHNIDPQAFRHATLHWLRHTFGHSMVDADVDMRIVQKAMGHVNINTTAAYSKADVEQMVRGLRQGQVKVEAMALPGKAPLQIVDEGPAVFTRE
jgi:site-specific recombinase XerD